jgi:FMN-dependent dehydrogenase
MGYLDEPSSDGPATAATVDEAKDTPPPAEASSLDDEGIPPLETIISAPDFEAAASKGMAHKTWAFYSSAATDLVTHRKNKELVRRIMLRPRVLRNVLNVNCETTILGFKSSAPFFISPAAMARLVHPDGELALSRGAANEGIIQCVSPAFFNRAYHMLTAVLPDLQQRLLHPPLHRHRRSSRPTFLFPAVHQLGAPKDNRNPPQRARARHQGHLRHRRRSRSRKARSR